MIGAALADVAHLAELRVLDPLLEALVAGEGAGQGDLAGLPPARQLLDHVLAVGAVLLEFDDVLLHLEAGDLGDGLDLHAVDLEAEGVADRAVEIWQSHGELPFCDW